MPYKADLPVGRRRPVRLFDRLAVTHPQRRVSHAIDDRGYDVANNYQYLDLWRILSVILMRDTDKNGVYTLEGEAPCRAIYAGVLLQHAGPIAGWRLQRHASDADTHSYHSSDDAGRVGTFSTGGVKLCVALPGDDMVAFR